MVDRVRLDPDLPVGAHAVRAGQVELERVERAAQGLRQDAVARRVGQPLEVVVAHQAARGVQEVLREARRAQPELVVGLLLSDVERLISMLEVELILNIQLGLNSIGY